MRFLIFLALTFTSFKTEAQDILTFKDGKTLPLKPMLIECIKAAEKGKDVNAPVYCDCILHLVAKHFTLDEMKQLISASKVNGATILFGVLAKEAPDEFYACAKASVTSDNTNWTKEQEDVFYRSCIISLLKDKSWNSKYDGEKYCKCNLLKMKNRYSDKELMNINNNPELMTIVKDCLKDCIKKQDVPF